jgi:glycosyltransferase involved in cell wall biosynthesis
MMKILVFTPSPPNEYNRIRLLNELKILNKLAEVTLVTLVTNEYEAHDLSENAYLCHKIIGVTTSKLRSYLSCCLALTTNSSLRSAYCSVPKLHKIASELALEDFDVVWIKRLRMAQYGRYFCTSKVVVDLTDSMELYYKRLCQLNLSGLNLLVSHYEKKILAEYENQIVKSYKTIVCSDVDANYIQKPEDLPVHNVTVIPNVVDLEKFNYQSPKQGSMVFKIGFFGVFSACPNEDAAWWLGTEIYPHLQHKFTNIECEIIGLSPSKRLLKLQKKSKIKVMGRVPNICDIVHQWDAFLCPLRSGAGVKNKILQCLALGVPVIATPLSLEGLINICVDEHLLVASTTQEFTEQLGKLKNDPELSLKLAESGRQYVENHYSFDSLEHSIKEMFNNFYSISQKNVEEIIP